MTNQIFKLPGRPYQCRELDRFRNAHGCRESLCKDEVTGGMFVVPSSMVDDACDPTAEMDVAQVERTWPEITPDEWSASQLKSTMVLNKEESDRSRAKATARKFDTNGSSVFARMPTASPPKQTETK